MADGLVELNLLMLGRGDGAGLGPVRWRAGQPLRSGSSWQWWYTDQIRRGQVGDLRKFIEHEITLLNTARVRDKGW